ncbi:c-type cytochrome [Persephonella sp.]
MRKYIVGVWVTFLSIYGVIFAADKEKAYALFKKYGCEGCHADYGVIAGPSFYMVKNKYLKEFNNDVEATKKYIIETIKNGSQGKWFKFLNMKMPSHKQILPEELRIIADWIVSIPPPPQKEKK